MRKDDAAPIGNTCPNIDDAQWHMNDFADDIESVAKRLRGYAKDLEKLRSENATLRQWGNEEYQRANALEKDVEDLKRHLDKAQDEINDLNTEINRIETSF